MRSETFLILGRVSPCGDGSWRRVQNKATCVDVYISAGFSWETTTTSAFTHRKKKKDYLTAYDPAVTVPWRTINYTIHPLVWGSHTHSWHSVEIFSSLVLPRKILTRAPKFPVLGLFSTWKEKWDKLRPSKPNFKILASKQWGKTVSLFQLKGEMCNIVDRWVSFPDCYWGVEVTQINLWELKW